jgi:uncharacterized iron-regulated membrane protein
LKITKRKIFALHSWLGLIAGIFILAICLSGAFVALIHQYEKSFEKEKLIVTPNDKRLPYDTLFAIAKEQVPDFQLYDYARLPQKADETLELLYFPDGSYHSVFIDPYTGDVKGKMALNLSKWLLKFHWSFFIGSQGWLGSIIVFSFAICLLISVVTGFIIYKRHLLDGLLFKTKINWKTFKTASSGLHRIIGVWSMLFLFILFSSGAFINYHIINGDWSYPGGTDLIQLPKQPLQISVDKCIAKAKETIPNFIPTGFSFPQLMGGDLSVSGLIKDQNEFYLSGSSVSFNPTTGQVTEITNGTENTSFSKFENIIYSLHYANYGGLFIKIIYCLLALISGLMPITGFVLWRRRTKRQKKNGI